MKKTTTKTKRTSDAAVQKATGKTWSEWFAVLDRAGATTMSHPEIAHWLYEHHLGKPGKTGGTNVATSGGWWSQMVTVEYERARGLRAVNQQADGFLVAVHKTVPGSVNALQRQWQTLLKSPAVAKKKLVPIPSKTKRAMLRYQTAIGKVIVSFDERGPGKARIMVESAQLPNKTAVETARRFWKQILSTIPKI